MSRSYKDFLEQAINRVLSSNQLTTPQNIDRLLSGDAEDLTNEQIVAIFPRYRHYSQSLGKSVAEDFDKENEELLSLIFWIMKTLSQSEISLPEFKLLFSAVDFIDDGGMLFDQFRQNGVVVSNQFINSILNFIQRLGVLAGEDKDPNVSNKPFEEFETAKVDGNWTECLRLWRVDRPVLEPYIIQSIKFLEKYSPTELCNALDRNGEYIVINEALDCLQEEATLLAAARIKGLVAFLATYKFLQKNNFRIEDEESIKLLSEAFKDSIDDKKVYAQWVSLYNGYSCRNERLVQVLLARSLVAVSNYECYDIYFSSIHLNSEPEEETRQAMDYLAKEFCFKASEVQKKIFFQKAFNVWDLWKFGASAQADNFLFRHAKSEIDSLVVRYIKFYLSTEENERQQNKIFGTLKNIINIWHKSPSDLITYWYREYSLFQPYCFAYQEKDSEICLQAKGQVFKFEELEDLPIV